MDVLACAAGLAAWGRLGPVAFAYRDPRSGETVTVEQALPGSARQRVEGAPGTGRDSVLWRAPERVTEASRVRGLARLRNGAPVASGEGLAPVSGQRPRSDPGPQARPRGPRDARSPTCPLSSPSSARPA